MSSTAILSPAELLSHWQGLRRVTRRVIEAFPEEHLHTFAVGGMRPFAALVGEMLAIAVPMAKQIAGGGSTEYDGSAPATKAELLAKWDEASAELETWYNQIGPERFGETITLFGQYTGTVWSQFFYAIDNENHHRGQGYVYLRALGIEPPPFWDRQ